MTAKHNPAARVLESRLTTDTTTLALQGGEGALVEEDAVSTLQMPEQKWYQLKRKLNRILGKKIDLDNLEGEGFGCLVLNPEESEAARKVRNNEKQELHSKFYLNWVHEGNLPAKKYRGLRVSLVTSGNQWFLNISFSPVKFLSGQNVLPVVGNETWGGRKINHTPAGYMLFGFNLLRLFCKRNGVDLSMYGLERDRLRWNDAHFAELIDCGSEEQRNTLLKFLLKAWRWEWMSEKEGRAIVRSIEALWGLKIQSYVPEERGDLQGPPSILVSKVFRYRTDAGTEVRTHPYKMLFYPKDIEIASNGCDTSQFTERVWTAIRQGMRLEFRINPDLFRIKTIRSFMLDSGWLEDEDLKDPRSWHLLNKLFPSPAAMQQRWPVLSQVLWQDSGMPVLMEPPHRSQIASWATQQSGAVKGIVEQWLASPDANIPGVQQLFNQGRVSKQTKVRDYLNAWKLFQSVWGFTPSHITPLALDLMLNAIDKAWMLEGEREHLEELQAKSRALHLAGMGYEAERLSAKRSATEASYMEAARLRGAKFQAPISLLSPNPTSELTLEVHTVNSQVKKQRPSHEG